MKRITPYKLASLGFDTGVGIEEPCPICEHKWGPHILSPTAGTTDGGTLVCNVKDCMCAGLWEPATRR